MAPFWKTLLSIRTPTPTTGPPRYEPNPWFEELRSQVICPMCGGIFTDPVVVGELQRTVCRACLSRCPSPRRTSGHQIHADLTMQRLVDSFHVLSAQNQPTIGLSESSTSNSSGIDSSAVDSPPPYEVSMVGRRQNDEITSNLDQNINEKGRDSSTAADAFWYAFDNQDLPNMKLCIQKGTSPDTSRATNSTALHEAAKLGRLEVMRLLLNCDASLDLLNDNGASPLHLAVSYHRQSSARLLLEHGANPNVSWSSKTTTLFVACCKQYLSLVQALLEKGADANTPSSKVELRPLHVMAQLGDVEGTKILLKFGCDLNSKANSDLTPLRLACKKERYKIAELLLEAGADCNRFYNGKVAPVHDTAKSGNKTMMQLLVDHGADPEALTADNYTPLHIAASKGNVEMVSYLLAKSVQVDERCATGHTPLLLAARRCSLPTVQILMKHGADIKAKSNCGATALHLAAENENTDNFEMLAFFLAQGLDVNAKSSLGRTPLHYAAKNGNISLLDVLMKTGKLDLWSKSDFNWTALHFAASANSIEMVKHLGTLGFNLQEQAGINASALEVAACANSTDIVGFLLDQGVKPVTTTGAVSTSVLHKAVRNENAAMVKRCLSAGADPNAGTVDGTRPLHLACSASSPEMVKLLISAKANPMVMDNFGMSSMDRAVTNTEILKLMTPWSDTFKPCTFEARFMRTSTFVQSIIIRCLKMRNRNKEHLLSSIFDALLHMGQGYRESARQARQFYTENDEAGIPYLDITCDSCTRRPGLKEYDGEYRCTQCLTLSFCSKCIEKRQEEEEGWRGCHYDHELFKIECGDGVDVLDRIEEIDEWLVRLQQRIALDTVMGDF